MKQHYFCFTRTSGKKKRIPIEYLKELKKKAKLQKTE